MHIKSTLVALSAASCLAISASSLASPPPFSLEGTPFEVAASEQGIEPTLLYALTLIESNDTAPHRGIDAGYVAPWPYTLRAPDEAFRYDTREEAEDALAVLLQETELIDIGWAQVNAYWHKGEVTSLEDLLDPLYNLQYASEYLSKSMSLAPGDPALGIGFYHNRADHELARNYGERVLAVQKNLNRIAE